METLNPTHALTLNALFSFCGITNTKSQTMTVIKFVCATHKIPMFLYMTVKVQGCISITQIATNSQNQQHSEQILI